MVFIVDVTTAVPICAMSIHPLIQSFISCIPGLILLIHVLSLPLLCVYALATALHCHAYCVYLSCMQVLTMNMLETVDDLQEG